MNSWVDALASACCASVVSLASTSAVAQEPCGATPARTPKPVPPVSLLAVLGQVPDGTTWAGLRPEARSALQSAADARLAWFRAEWDRRAMDRKESVLLTCPTEAMVRAMDRYLGQEVANKSPDFAIRAVKNAGLRRALVRLYMASFAAYRAGITYPVAAHPNTDWDGVSAFDSFPLPDAVAFADIRGHAAAVVKDLQSIPDASLEGAERIWRREALFNARQLRAGGFIATRGGQDWHLPCQVSGAGDLVASAYAADKGVPTIYLDHEEAVAEFNAIYLHNTTMKWVDTGTFLAARDNALCNSAVDETIKEAVESRSPEAGRAMRMLRGWWLERTGAALPSYTLYRSADRSALWEAFTAEQRTVNDGSTTMETYAAQVDAFRREKVAAYRQAAAAAVQALFVDDAVLTPGQRATVLDGIAKEEAFGRMKDRLEQMLDQAQATEDGPAARAWQAALKQHVLTLGGLTDQGDVAPEHVAKAKAMFGEVQAWLVKRYPNYPQPIDEALKKIRITYTAGFNATADPQGEIKFGLGTPRSLLEYYSLMLHELRHAVRAAAAANAPDPSKVATDDGTAVEGSGVAAEDLLRVPFLHDVLHDKLAVLLYQLDFAIRDARFIATTEATLKRYAQEQCGAGGCPDTNDAARAIAVRYGLTGPLAETLATRSHLGTQYLQYIFSGEQVKADLAWLSGQVGPPGRQIDPFMLFGCGLNTPRRDADYVARLKACLQKIDQH